MPPTSPPLLRHADRFHDELAEANALTDLEARILRYRELIRRYPIRADLLGFNLATALAAAGRSEAAGEEALRVVRQAPLLWERLPGPLQVVAWPALPLALRCQQLARVDPVVFVGKAVAGQRLARVASTAPALVLFDSVGEGRCGTARLWRESRPRARVETDLPPVAGYARLLAVARVDGIAFDLLEAAHGRTLVDLLGDARFSFVIALEVVRQVCRIVAELHARQCAHGAIAPDVVVCDEARLVPLVTLTAASSVDSVPPRPADDLRAIGRLLEWLLTGAMDGGGAPLGLRLPPSWQQGGELREPIAVAEALCARCRQGQAVSARELAELLAPVTRPETLGRQPSLVPRSLTDRVDPSTPGLSLRPARRHAPATARPSGPHGTAVLEGDVASLAPPRPTTLRRGRHRAAAFVAAALAAAAIAVVAWLRVGPKPPVPVVRAPHASAPPPPLAAPTLTHPIPIRVTSAVASSIAATCHGGCQAAYAVDGSPATSWCFDGSRDAAPGLTLSWRGTGVVRALDVATGYAKSERTFDRNGRVTELRVQDDEGPLGTFTLSATWEMHDNRLTLSRPARGRLVLEVTQTDQGRQGHDVCLGDVVLWERAAVADRAR